jgi:hypothetical protein
MKRLSIVPGINIFLISYFHNIWNNTEGSSLVITVASSAVSLSSRICNFNRQFVIVETGYH